MPAIAVFILALLLPRLTIFLLWLLTNWFNTLSAGLFLPILGFIFMPYTLLWYSVVMNMYGGVWGPWPIFGLIIAILSDLSSSSYGYGHYHIVEHTEEAI